MKEQDNPFMNHLRRALSVLLLVTCLIAVPQVVRAGDAGAPIPDAPRAIGGTVFSGYLNETNTHVRLNVSVGNDPANIGGEVATYVSLNVHGPADVEVGARHTILAGEIGTKFDVPDISMADILTAISTSTLQEGFSLTFKKRVYEGDGDPLSLVALGTLTVALTGNHPAPSIDNVYVGLTTTDANSYTFSPATTSFEFVITNDSDLNTLTCTIDSLATDDCFSFPLTGAVQTYSYASSTSLSDGAHTLAVVATDVFGQSDSASVSFCVDTCTPDTTPPVIAAAADISVTTSNSAGTAVTYTSPAATDDTDPIVAVSCSPLSGTVFAVGDTTVTCTAQDTALNVATPVTFAVRVSLQTSGGQGNGPPDLIPPAANPAPPSVPISTPPAIMGDPAPEVVMAPVVVVEATAAPTPVAVPSLPQEPTSQETPQPQPRVAEDEIGEESMLASAQSARVLVPENTNPLVVWILISVLAFTAGGAIVWRFFSQP